ncbi:S-adenosyl-L-methionine-dependent methyltransferase [Dothidotthia symphoricarpi CBS 119687]|uniref:S-adenosyl-L-methionine-dependent methyltransferase n=1 Tax=Dothidotthia symphoricarpi CBS 119687 TaxID=1392245 RepID=A0A6A6ACS9_9PLEO|nr:S-adenosyl-L-methionine-dependent methyltransferase [Dothidotthia symphoricarpi CBS 119687]KAF2129629.1 S-adenosyl-L-methionine-dependent methyltransferase [Dothidotthia symphoricarpi CBS 119687]
MVNRSTQAWQGSAYFLPCDNEESHRLSLQHEFITRTLSGSLLLLPKSFISNLDSEDTKVLDVGTGNAVWLSDFHSMISSTAQLVGIDIEGRMYPAKYPLQMSFEVGSVLSLPTSWSNSFDLVYQRLLLAGLKISDWPTAISEDFRVLKSGGYVQLVEVDLRNMDVGPNSARLLDTLKKLFAMNNMDLNQADSLPSLVKGAGFVDVQVHDKEWRLHGDSNVLSRENALRGHRGLKGPVVKYGLFSSDAEFDDMMTGVETEWKSTLGKALIIRVITGRKP